MASKNAPPPTLAEGTAAPAEPVGPPARLDQSTFLGLILFFINRISNNVSSLTDKYITHKIIAIAIMIECVFFLQLCGLKREIDGE